VIHELAANPNVHAPIGPGRSLITDPAGRFVLFLTTGTSPRCATVQRVRVGTDEVEELVAEIRLLLQAEGRDGAEWELGDGTEPPDLVERLQAIGILPDREEPIARGMVLEGRPPWELPQSASARPVESLDELRIARTLQREGFGDPRPVEAGLEDDFRREGHDGSTFLALVDGEPAGAGYAAYTPWGLILFGGAIVARARGRGGYRALVAARAEEAERRGTPVLVTHAGHMSQPILERLGFVAVTRIDRLLDVF
jgi:hypothetical protein